jgi:Rod binding domain-containing protein
MKVDNPFTLDQSTLSEARKQKNERENAAVQFEEIFAKHLVKELTKDSFKIEGGVMGGANKMYREFVTDALATELAAQRKLGMADLVSTYWNQDTVDQSQITSLSKEETND